MKATGIVCRMDELGRIVIPKEIRRSLRIQDGDRFEIFVDQMDGQPMVCFRKYEIGFLHSLFSLADAIDDEMMYDVSDEQRSEVRKHFNEIAKILSEWKNEG